MKKIVVTDRSKEYMFEVYTNTKIYYTYKVTEELLKKIQGSPFTYKEVVDMVTNKSKFLCENCIGRILIEKYTKNNNYVCRYIMDDRIYGYRTVVILRCRNEYEFNRLVQFTIEETE